MYSTIKVTKFSNNWRMLGLLILEQYTCNTLFWKQVVARRQEITD